MNDEKLKSVLDGVDLIKDHFGKGKSAGPTALFISMVNIVFKYQNNGSFCASNNLLSEISGISPRSVSTYVTGLASCGLIEVESGCEPGYANFQNLYRLNL
jgi:hypothetical protein